MFLLTGLSSCIGSTVEDFLVIGTSSYEYTSISSGNIDCMMYDTATHTTQK